MPFTKRDKPHKRKSHSLSSPWKARTILFLLGLIFILPGIILSYFNHQSQISFETKTFSQEPVKISLELLKNKPQGVVPNRIIIPSVTIDASIKEAPIINGYWEVFEDSAGYGLGSGTAGEKGNMVIFAHTRPGLFQNLKNIKAGELVYVLTKEKWFTYKVNQIKDVYPNDIDVISPTKDETLTLYTCTGFTDEKRLIVTAKRVSL